MAECVGTRMNVCLLCVCVLLCPAAVSPDTFTSIASLKSLVNNEEWLLQKVDEYLVKEESRIQSIRGFLENLTRWTADRKYLTEQQWDDHVTSLVEHPVNALKLIKDWVHVTKLSGSGSAELFSSVTHAAGMHGIELPGESDYKGAIAGLIRLQKTYQLPTSDMAIGKVRNATANHSMDRADYYEMAQMLMLVDHSLAASWFQMLLDEGPTDVDMERNIHLKMMEIYDKAGDFERAYESAAKAFAIESSTYIGSLVEDIRRKLNERETSGGKPRQHYYWKNARDRGLEHYESLCRGDYIKNDITVTKDLKCVYRPGVLPYIQYKEEIHWLYPRISLILDAITDKQADLLKEKAFPTLYRAQVGDPSKSVTSDERVGKLSWLWDTDSEVRRISEKVGDITGLSTTYTNLLADAEAFQIVNYGIGGQYEPHYDYYEDLEMLDHLPPFIMGTGDRISTFMFYLNEVEAGGATVFPNLGVRVPPIKHAAAYWYNFDLDGLQGNKLTLHAGCPVLLGQKWVANKWIRQFGQMFKRPCPLTEHQQDPIWYS